MGLSNLPLAAGAAHLKAFKRLGFEKRAKQPKGSHVIVSHSAGRMASIPMVNEVKRATLAKILAVNDIGEAEYLDAFRR